MEQLLLKLLQLLLLKLVQTDARISSGAWAVKIIIFYIKKILGMVLSSFCYFSNHILVKTFNSLNSASYSLEYRYNIVALFLTVLTAHLIGVSGHITVLTMSLPCSTQHSHVSACYSIGSAYLVYRAVLTVVSAYYLTDNAYLMFILQWSMLTWQCTMFICQCSLLNWQCLPTNYPTVFSAYLAVLACDFVPMSLGSSDVSLAFFIWPFCLTCLPIMAAKFLTRLLLLLRISDSV